MSDLDTVILDSSSSSDGSVYTICDDTWLRYLNCLCCFLICSSG